jgi:hypothetical protein
MQEKVQVAGLGGWFGRNVDSVRHHALSSLCKESFEEDHACRYESVFASPKRIYASKRSVGERET